MPRTYVETVKQVVARALVLHEELQVLEDSLLDGHLVVVTNGILTEEVKGDHVVLAVLLLVQLDVLEPERAATDRVSRFAFFLLVTCSQRELTKAKTLC
jgi:hypothetical protein